MEQEPVHSLQKAALYVFGDKAQVSCDWWRGGQCSPLIGPGEGHQGGGPPPQGGLRAGGVPGAPQDPRRTAAGDPGTYAAP